MMPLKALLLFLNLRKKTSGGSNIGAIPAILVPS